MGEHGGMQAAVLDDRARARAVRPHLVVNEDAALLDDAPPLSGSAAITLSSDLRRDLLTILSPVRATNSHAPAAAGRTNGRCNADTTEIHVDLREDAPAAPHALRAGPIAPIAPTAPTAPPRVRSRCAPDPVPPRRTDRWHGSRPRVFDLDRARRIETPRTAPGPGYRFVKAFFDRVDAALLLVLLSPVLLAAAVAVKLTSPGPVFFQQERLGQGGRRFRMLKLRTMVCDAEERLRELGLYERYVELGYKLPPEEDCRMTPIGRFLRRTSIDELPQLINVLRGDMSLVGPRPIVPPELSCYGDRADCYLEVRPGLTGLWQVTGRSTVTFPERGEIDAEYHVRRSIWFDLRILVRTPKAVLRGTGAY